MSLTFPMGSLHSQIEKVRRGRGNQRSRTHSRELRQGRLWCHACMQTACRACASGKCLRRATSCESSEGHSVPRDGSETTGSVVPLLSRRSRVSCQRRGSREGGPQAPAVSERARARAATQAHRCPLWLYRPVGRGRAEKSKPGRVPPATAHWHASADACLPGFRTDRIRHHARARHRRTTVTGRRGLSVTPEARPSNSRPRKSPAHRRADKRHDQPGTRTAQRTTVLHDTELGSPLYGPVSRLSSALGYRKSGPSAFPPWPCSHRRAQHTVPRAHK